MGPSSGRELFRKTGYGKRYVDLKSQEISLDLKVVGFGSNF